MTHQDLDVTKLINTELRELRNAGFEEDILRTMEEKSKGYILSDNYAGFLRELEKLDRSQLQQHEPSTYEAIKELSTQRGKSTFIESRTADLYDRIYGAWLGRWHPTAC